MSFVTILQRFKVLANTAANLIAENGKPLARELVAQTDTGRVKLGDGTSLYNALKYINLGFIDLSALVDGSILYRDGTEWKCLAPGADTQVLTLVSGVPAWAAGGGGGGSTAWTLVGSSTITGSAATSLSISGLDLSADGSYRIEYSFKNATGSSANVSLYYNGDSTSTNYDRAQMASGSSGGTAASSRANDGIVMTIDASNTNIGIIRIQSDVNGRACAFVSSNRNGSSLQAQVFAQRWQTAGNENALAFTSAIANALDVGSYIKVWKIN